MSKDTHRFKHPAIVCRCMDVTLEDMIKAFEVMINYLGSTDADTYRRVSSSATGFCQGRGCLQHLQRILSSEMRRRGAEVKPEYLVPRRRPPLQPVPIAVFARNEVLK